ncbi:MAG TPA: DUF1631 family protein, partial [Rubrivivax sp.]|nr:DUF1631 family protein [Rubrivivax sp.]
DERLLREVGPSAAETPPPPSAPATPTNWDALSLVDDSEMEAQISADRFGMEIAHGCEWELRELDAYVGALLGDAGGPSERNPLRPDLIGHAMMRGIESVSDRGDIRKVLAAEMSRSLGSLLPAAYAAVVAELRHAGVQPLGLSVRHRPSHAVGGDSGRHDLGPGAAPGEENLGPARTVAEWASGHGGAPPSVARQDSRYGGADSNPSHRRTGGGAYGPTTRSGFAGRGGGTPIGHVDPALMSLIRRLAYTDPVATAGATDYGDHGSGAAPAPLPNLIRAHRDELRQASHGTLDHMVIDVIGFLFDQILADPKVPPQMARQIARLQLPVLRAALGDPTFFSSRRHPVRRFVNRIASLGAAFEDFGGEEARAFLAKVRELVNEVVEGDFDQIELYDQKLAALEAFTAQQSGDAAQPQGEAAALLAEKEDQLRLRQLYAQRLAGDLKDVAAPAFLRDFISRVWSQVMLRAAEQGGADGPQAQRLRRAGRELFLSVQPKPTPAHRKAFLAELPKLMQELSDGMNLIGWPEAQRRDFFGQLMPAHAEALKSPAGRQLDINMMARQVEGALERALPSAADLKAAAATLPVLTDEIVLPRFSAEEVRRVGLVEESAVDWNGQVDIEVGGEAEAEADADGADHGAAAPGAGRPGEPPEPTEGRALADSVQLGFAYQMNLGGQWQKVRLSHVSPGRSFFIFTHGSRHKQTVSLTQRMLARLAETGRLRAFESATLIDRATARARRQLAKLRPSA